MSCERFGSGTTITFASGFLAEILNVDWSGMKREAVDNTHMTSSGSYMEFDPACLIDPGELDVEIQFDTDAEPPIDGDKETITVTFASGTTWAAAGFMTEFSFKDPHDAKMTASCKLKFSGPVTITPAP